jgi:uncharacterized protein YggE
MKRERCEMAERVITVKGIGKAEVHPDLVSIGFVVERTDADYEKSVSEAADAVEELTKMVITLGFDKSDLKTTNWEVEQEYENKKNKNGEYERQFTGYKTTHDLKLEFGLTEKALPKVISEIAACKAMPEFSISFTIKDKTAVSEKILVSATENAFSKAKIIAQAARVSLGNVITIDYDWSEYNFYSETRYNRSFTHAGRGEIVAMDVHNTYSDIEPDDIKLRDTITFVWEIA